MVDKKFAEKIFKTLAVLKDDECIVAVRHKGEFIMAREKKENVFVCNSAHCWVMTNLNKTKGGISYAW